MRRATATLSFILGLLLLAPVGTAWATDIWDQASTNDDTDANTRNVLLPGDSQRHDVQFKPGPTADQDWYRLVVAGGHSYEVRVGGRQDTCFDFVGSNFEVRQSNGQVSGALITTGVDIVGANQISSYRATFVAPTDDNIFVHLTGLPMGGGPATCTATSEYTIQFFDTTLVSPRWSSFGGFYTTWGFANATNASISVTLKVFPGGSTTPLATATFNIPAGQGVFRDTRPTDLNIGPNQAGFVVVTHTGPADGIQADGFITNEQGVVFVTVPVKFDRAVR